MNLLQKIILKNKEKIIPELYYWADTFDEDVSYNIIINLIKKLENNTCTEQDFEDIKFNIDQINYDGEIIKLT